MRPEEDPLGQILLRALDGKPAVEIVERDDCTEGPAHLAYHELNRSRGRAAGQLRARVRFRKFATPWFDYLIVSQEELRTIVDGTGWRVRRFIDDAGPLYCAILEH